MRSCPDTYLYLHNAKTGSSACVQVDYHTIPDPPNDVLWFSALGLSMGLMVALYASYRSRPKCKWCGARHPNRHRLMTTEEYLRLYCGGWKARLREIQNTPCAR